MSRPFAGLRRFFAELKRRSVWRVAAVYAATAFVVVQVADLTFPRLGLPGWTVTLVIALAGLGFPLAIVLAWAFEMTPEGVRRTGEAPSAASRPERRAGTSGPLSPTVAVVVAAGLVVAATGAWWLRGGGGPDAAAAPVDRLAVLPLANLMDDPEQAYFVHGMHDRLIAELQQVGVPVIARTSVMRYADGEAPVREVARELDVDGVVEGTVLRYGDSVEIEARLVDPESEEYLWRRSFTGSLRDAASLHRTLTRAIAEEIHAALAPEDEARLARGVPVDPRAYEAYLRGDFHLQRFSAGDFDRALDYFERAVAIDSSYAPAWLGIARVWGYRAQASGMTGVTAAEARRHWEPALERALALDSTLAEAHAHRAGTTTWADWRFREGVGQFRRALALNPDLPRARMFYAHLLTILGQWEEARRQAEEAVEIDPLNPFIQGLYGVHLTLTRRHEEAIRVLETMYRRHPGAHFGRTPLVGAYEATGRYGDALRIRVERYQERGDGEVVAALEGGFEEGGGGEAGYRLAVGRAADVLAARRRDGEAAPGAPWQLYAAAGEEEEEEAVRWLAEAVRARDQNMPYLGVHPGLEPLHENPRFRTLVEDSVGVPLLTGPAGT